LVFARVACAVRRATLDRYIAATMRALSYPGRGTTPTAWVREALPEARKAINGSLGRRSYPRKLMQPGVWSLASARKVRRLYVNVTSS
jgi:hypothetical protein